MISINKVPQTPSVCLMASFSVILNARATGLLATEPQTLKDLLSLTD